MSVAEGVVVVAVVVDAVFDERFNCRSVYVSDLSDASSLIIILCQA